MKYLYLAFLLLGAAFAETDLQDVGKGSDEDFVKQIWEIFQKQCQEVGGDAAVKNLTTAINNIDTCLKQHVPKSKADLKNLADSSSEEDICSDKRKEIRHCFDELVFAWKGCNEEGEKFIAEFILDAVEAVFDFVCKDPTDFVFKILNSFDCIIDLVEGDIEDVCEDKFVTDDDNDVTKDEVCKDLQSVEVCYGDFIEKKCPGSDLKVLVTDLVHAVSSPCRKGVKRHGKFLGGRF